MKDVRVKAGVKVGDLVRFKGYDDVLGVLVGALGIVLDTEGKSTVRVRWLNHFNPSMAIGKNCIKSLTIEKW